MGNQDSAGDNVYINEQLTAFDKGLHKEARDLTIHSVKFVWTTEGKIVVREREGSTIVHVKDNAYFKKLEDKLKSKDKE